jgi:hypothetical protein
MTPMFGHYEFNAYENSILEKTAARAKLWGIISAVLGVIECLAGIGGIFSPSFLVPLPLGIVAIVVGITFIGVGNSLGSAVTTRGNDLMHVMQAMEKLNTAFLIEVICHLIGIGLLFILLFFMFLFSATS